MTASFPELWILRHGQTEWNVAGRLQGQADSALTKTGLEQARRQNAVLLGVLSGREARVISSPAKRALRTAEIAVEGLGLWIESDPALREIEIGQWQGRTVEEIHAAHPDLPDNEDPHLWKFNAPGGETIGQMQERVQAFLYRLNAPTVVVTHGVTSRMLRCLALGLEARDMSQVPGGQGIVHYLKDGQAQVLE